MTDLVAVPRATWAARLSPPALGPITPLDGVDPDDLVEVYAPLAALLARWPHATGGTVMVGIAGSVAVGKSTTAGALRHLLAPTSSVEIVSTDGFLLSNAVLDERDLVLRKGFPESYDTPRLVDMLRAVRAGQANVVAPLYDHRTYDVITDRHQVIDRPDILLVEGVNALASPAAGLLDLRVYLDADEGDIRTWFVQRFLDLASEAEHQPDSFFARWSGLSTEQVVSIAEVVWDQINGVNLASYILPTRQAADVVLVKDAGHRVREVLVRRDG